MQVHQAPTTTFETVTRGRSVLPRASRSAVRAAGRDAVIAISWANLSFLRLWSSMGEPDGSQAFYIQFRTPPAAYAAAMLDVYLLALVLWVCLRCVRSGQKGWRRVSSLLVLATASAALLNAVRAIASFYIPHLRFLEWVNNPHLRPALLAGGFAAAVLLWAYHRLAARAFCAVLLVMSPFAALRFYASAAAIVQRKPIPPDQRQAARFPVNPAPPRVVWVLLDEWDYRLTFEARSRGLALPEIDRLKSEALFASRAYSPRNSTHVSVPALLTGHNVVESQPTAPDALGLSVPEQQKMLSWAEAPNLFSHARQSGLNVGVAGWYFPYCRIFGSQMADCSWSEIGSLRNSLGQGFGTMALNGLRVLFQTPSYSLFGRALTSAKHAEVYRDVVGPARRMAADPSLGIVFLHLPVPHGPFIYDRSTGGFTRRNAWGDAYGDALALADKTVGDLRRSMEAAGVWENSVVLISSDHWYRESPAAGPRDHRVPFILKLPHGHSAATYEGTFNTVLSESLLFDVIKGRVADAPSALRWLEDHRAAAPRSALELRSR